MCVCLCQRPSPMKTPHLCFSSSQLCREACSHILTMTDRQTELGETIKITHLMLHCHSSQISHHAGLTSNWFSFNTNSSLSWLQFEIIHELPVIFCHSKTFIYCAEIVSRNIHPFSWLLISMCARVIVWKDKSQIQQKSREEEFILELTKWMLRSINMSMIIPQIAIRYCR